MRKSQAKVLFVATMLVVGTSTARAQTQLNLVPSLTGTTTVGVQGSVAYQSIQSIEGLQGEFSPNENAINISFNGSVSNSVATQQCTIFPNTFVCTDQWSGTYSGGTVSLFSYFNTTNGAFRYDSTGGITGGSFSGNETCALDFPCFFSQEAIFDFTSTWTTGWRSDGMLDVVSMNGGSGGTLDMTTVTPEPGSMMLVASGIFVVAFFLPRKSSNPKIQYCTRA